MGSGYAGSALGSTPGGICVMVEDELEHQKIAAG
jgi:hypothetical protein